ncbi:hypothetical protein LIER_07038 [Lithospermum erythrorhizon]|uniref:Uncharacterized protein n=1 Tax=Lithospermum erythrorhizon TaxID=34254 RepID=A0AAV3PB09_LITER
MADTFVTTSASLSAFGRHSFHYDDERSSAVTAVLHQPYIDKVSYLSCFKIVLRVCVAAVTHQMGLLITQFFLGDSDSFFPFSDGFIAGDMSKSM